MLPVLGDPFSFSSRTLGVRLTWDDLEGPQSEGTLVSEISPSEVTHGRLTCINGSEVAFMESVHKSCSLSIQ